MIKKILRIILAILSLIFLCWFIAPFFWNIRHIGCFAGIILSAAVFFRTAFASLYHRIKNRMKKRKLSTVLLRIVQIGSVLVMLYAVAISALMVFAMIPKEVDDDATAIVLGAQVKPWGPSTLLRQRIDAAEQYLKEHPFAAAVVTGGKGDDEPESEADCMYETMVKDGIDPKRIYREDKAKNTDENLWYSTIIIRDNHLKTPIAIVTDSYHQFRARLAAKKHLGSVMITPVNAQNTYVAGVAAYPSYFVREWFAIPAYILNL